MGSRGIAGVMKKYGGACTPISFHISRPFPMNREMNKIRVTDDKQAHEEYEEYEITTEIVISIPIHPSRFIAG